MHQLMVLYAPLELLLRARIVSTCLPVSDAARLRVAEGCVPACTMLAAAWPDPKLKQGHVAISPCVQEDLCMAQPGSILNVSSKLQEGVHQNARTIACPLACACSLHVC